MDDFLEKRDHAPLKDSDRWMSYSMEDLYPEWQEKAHCAGVGHEHYFGTEEDEMPARIRLTRNAAKLCDVCPVFRECLLHALQWREEYGVWAGTSGRTRRRMFTLMDTGEATAEDIVKAVCSERRGIEPPSRIRGEQGGDRLPDEDAGAVATGYR